MRFHEILHLVWINIVENKVKMMMTSLGIIVGAATIVLVIAIGKGGQKDVADQFKNLNAGAIEVSVTTQEAGMMEMMGEMPGGFGGMDFGSMPSMNFGGENRPSMGSGGGMPSMPGGGGMPSMGGSGSRSNNNNSQRNGVVLNTEDVDDLQNYVSGLSAVTILISGETTVFGGSLEAEKNSTVAGVLPNYPLVSNLAVQYGNFITEEQQEYAEYVCVIGHSLAEELFTYPTYAYGDYLEIDGKNYEIVGVLEKMGSVSSGISPDDAVYVPYSTAVKQIFGSGAESTIAAVAEDVSNVETAMENIETVLKENYPQGYFSVTDAGSAMEAATQSADTLAAMLLAVASIVFIVGGIGIMNVFFVSVKERTAEIGLLKAIGCSRSTILIEFLTEAAVISLFGGIVGVALSYLIMPLVEKLGSTMVASPSGAVLALLFAVITGTVFGFYPAWKASQLEPIEALNHQ